MSLELEGACSSLTENSVTISYMFSVGGEPTQGNAFLSGTEYQ